MSPGHLLYYFGTKERLLLEALRASEADLTLERSRIVGSSADPRSALVAFLELYLPTGRGDPRWTLWTALWDLTGADEDARRAQAEMDEAWERDLRAIVLAGCEQQIFVVEAIDDFVTVCTSLLDGLSIRVVTGEPGMDRDEALRLGLAFCRTALATTA